MAPRSDSTQSMSRLDDSASPMKEDSSVSSTGPTCEELYGPYPDPTPQPWQNSRNEGREGDRSEKVDFRDEGSPDAWLPRDGRMVRLTGKHPFNVEPPVAELQRYGFLTPPQLHYVRNHGACPQLSWDTHTVQVSADGDAVNSSTTFTMDQLAAMPTRELPVTLVCAGNRRKEQNMLRQTIGFNWGCSGVGTNVYKGVLLRDLLLQAGVVSEDVRTYRNKHVEFVGVEDLPNKVGPGPFPDEPWGKLVKYGTSIPLARAMNPAYDVLIAYQANGQFRAHTAIVGHPHFPGAQPQRRGADSGAGLGRN